MPFEESKEIKTETEIKLKRAESEEIVTHELKDSSSSAMDMHGLASNEAESSVKKLSSEPAQAVRILKELPTDEFLDLLEQSSPEQLQSFLEALAPPQQPLLQAVPKIFGHMLAIPDEPRDALSIIAWWESRRLLFNLVVGLLGLPTILILAFFGLAELPLLISSTIEYGLLANICYTAGWAAELQARSWWKERAKHLGPVLFSLGFAFASFLTIATGFVAVLIFFLLSFART
ncbi:MAG: hypothetical protein K2X27_12255 [Candidatus Obscuribacterales bacterium]|nr:hypothetical protein [Candidatus Obscuribacterales bacterium]